MVKGRDLASEIWEKKQLRKEEKLVEFLRLFVRGANMSSVGLTLDRQLVKIIFWFLSYLLIVFQKPFYLSIYHVFYAKKKLEIPLEMR